MADISSDSEDNSSRVQQEWEVVSLSASGMSAASAPASADDIASPTASGMTETTSDLPDVTALLQSQYIAAPYPSQPDQKVIYQEDVEEVAATDSEEVSSEGPKELGADFTLGTESQFAQMFCGKSWIEVISNRAISPGDSSITRDSLDISDFDLKSPGVETDLGEDNLLVQSPDMSSSVPASSPSAASDTGMDKSDSRPIDEEHRCAAAREGDIWARDFLALNQEEVVQVAGGAVVERENEKHEQAKEEEQLPTIRRSTSATSLVKVYAYEGWWKRKASCLLVQARQASSIWSLALAAAVIGLVLLGQRWHRERCQNQQLRLQLYSREDRISELLRQVKDLTERRRVHLIRSGSYGGLLN